jgi:DNA-binding beta-propeller fold protein YncE
MWSYRYFWIYSQTLCFLWLTFVSTPVVQGQVSISDPQNFPALPYEPVADFFQLPPGDNFVEPAGIAVNSQGHIYVFHRGKHPLMEFDGGGKFIRSIADDLFLVAHSLRVDAHDNIWTVDNGTHVVVELNPEGRVLLALGGFKKPGADWLDFNQPTDVAIDREGNIFVADGYVNMRIMKFDRSGNFLFSWGVQGGGPGQFEIPHSIGIDGDLVYVADRENGRIQIFDRNGKFLRQWMNIGHPYGLFITSDHFIWICDGWAGRFLKLDTDGRIVGGFTEIDGHGPEGRGDPHQLWVTSDGSIYTVEVSNWRARKFVLKHK